MTNKEIKARIKAQFKPIKARLKLQSMLNVRKLKDEYLKGLEEQRKQFFTLYDVELYKKVRAYKLNSLEH